MGAPGLISSQVAKDPGDYFAKRMRDLERRIDELGPSVAASFATTVATLNTTVATLTTAVANIAAQEAYIVAPGVVFGVAANFAVTTTETAVISSSITVPPGFTKAVVSVTGRVIAVNNNTTADYLSVHTTIAGYYAYNMPLLCLANGGSGINVAPFAFVGTGLVAGSTIPITVTAKSQTANWATNIANQADISGSIIWFR
jgi:uncharacterized coiled-coil protein SlyX